MVTPGEFGLAGNISLKISDMFDGDGNFIARETLNNRVGIKILELQYNNLRFLVYSNLGENLCYKPKGELDIEERKPYFRVSLRELFLKDKKGSKNFREVFKYNNRKPIDYGEVAWKKILGREICRGELMNGFRCMQDKFFPRDLLDIKVRLMLRKMQFNDRLEHWIDSTESNRCYICQAEGGISKGTLLHMIYECPSIQYIF